MGKRKRNNGSKARRNGRETGAGSSSQAVTKADEAKDVDADCVHYESSSQGSGPAHARLISEFYKNAFDLRSDSDLEFDSDQDKEENNEFIRSIDLNRNKEDESDVELSVDFFDPRKDDENTISTLLCKYSKACTSVSKAKEQVTTSGALARMVCDQTRVGTTIRLSDDEAAIGFISCVNIREHAKVLRDLKRKLVQVAEKEKNERFITLLNKCMEGVGRFDSERMGLVLCERVVNMPTMVVGKMLEALFCEIEWATEDEKTHKQRDAFKFGWYLYIAEVYCYKEENDKEEGDKEGKKKRQRTEGKEGEEKLAFARIEDSEWYKHASCSVRWEWGGAEDGVKQKRIAMVVASRKVAAIRQAVEQRIGGYNGEEGGDQTAGDQTSHDKEQ